MTGPRVLTVPPITEKQFMAQVKDLATVFGWDFYHPYLSIHSARGWPDLALCRPPRLVLAELKTEKGKVSEHQAHWLDILGQCDGVEVYVWRPSSWDRIAEVLK